MAQQKGNSSIQEHIIPITVEGDEVVSDDMFPSTNESRSICITEDSSTDDENITTKLITAVTISSDSDKDILEKEEQILIEIPERTLPSCNVPEKIVIVFDRALDENCTNFQLTSGKTYSPLFMLQHAINLFLHNKSCINNQHEFALIVLNESSASWVHDFTNSAGDIIRSINEMKECETEDIFDLNGVFDLIMKKVKRSGQTDKAMVNLAKNDLLIPPMYIVRTLLLYGRSYSIPQLTRTDEIQKLLDSPYFTVDSIMTHEPPSMGNHCEKIFRVLQEIDTKGFGYSFSVSRNSSDLHLAMAKVLSHPLQRPHQLSAKYTLNYD